jgi:lactate dehydrogenase-like 2-hydroxyacid dehydrogenase
MKPLIYVTRSLPLEIVRKLEERFQLCFWEEEDFVMLEQAIEQAETEYKNASF